MRLLTLVVFLAGIWHYENRVEVTEVDIDPMFNLLLKAIGRHPNFQDLFKNPTISNLPNTRALQIGKVAIQSLSSINFSNGSKLTYANDLLDVYINMALNDLNITVNYKAFFFSGRPQISIGTLLMGFVLRIPTVKNKPLQVEQLNITFKNFELSGLGEISSLVSGILNMNFIQNIFGTLFNTIGKTLINGILLKMRLPWQDPVELPYPYNTGYLIF